MSLQQISIKNLLCTCISQVENFQNTYDTTGDSSSCDEIVRRAAAGNLEAVAALLYDITKPLIEKRCPPDLKNQRDDLVQDVLMRMLYRLRHPDLPFVAQGFPAYRHYLNLTISKSISLLRPSNDSSSLEDLIEQEMEATVEQDSMIELQETVNGILSRITNPVGREIIRRQYVDNESYDEILVALQLIDPTMNKKKIYKLAENSLKQLKKSFGVGKD